MREKEKLECAANVLRHRLEGAGAVFPDAGMPCLGEACMELPFHGRGTGAVGTRYIPGLRIPELRCASVVGGKMNSSPRQLGA